MGKEVPNPEAPAADKPPKKSFFGRLRQSKNGKPLSEEDILRVTGKSRDEINQWAENAPGVGKNQLAGKLAMGETSGLGGLETANGYGGWGWSAESNDKNRGMKFPPTQENADKKP